MKRWIVAIAVLASACAGVTGLGDYALVDDGVPSTQNAALDAGHGSSPGATPPVGAANPPPPPGGSAPDAGPDGAIVTPPANPPPPSGIPGTVGCGAQSCATCCWDKKGGSCAGPSGCGIGTSSLSCDGPSDCTASNAPICCLVGSTASCLASCSGSVACDSLADCQEGQGVCAAPSTLPSTFKVCGGGP